MITKVESEMLECDMCQTHFEDYNGFAVFCDRNTMLERAMEYDWQTHGDKHFCPACVPPQEEEPDS